jgi:hypothetical protein
MIPSKYHLNFCRFHALSDALDNPEKYFGPNYATLLNFWNFLENLTKGQVEKLPSSVVPANYSVFDESRNIIKDYWYGCVGCLGSTVFDNCPKSHIMAHASHEIIAMHSIIERGYKIKALPLFENL